MAKFDTFNYKRKTGEEAINLLETDKKNNPTFNAILELEGYINNKPLFHELGKAIYLEAKYRRGLEILKKHARDFEEENYIKTKLEKLKNLIALFVKSQASRIEDQQSQGEGAYSIMKEIDEIAEHFGEKLEGEVKLENEAENKKSDNEKLEGDHGVENLESKL